MELRNPFGLQNGQIIMIEDIDKAHNGLRCNCVCPACKEPFIARMGDVNQHHFAHSGKGCDEINAYMTGFVLHQGFRGCFMLRIYKNKKDIPTDKEYVELNDIFFNMNTSCLLDDRAKDIIRDIDASELISRYKILSRFNGDVLNTDKLSTSCKTVLNVMYYPDKVFCLKGCGEEAVEMLFAFEKGAVYSDYAMIPFDFDKVEVCSDGKMEVIDDYEELKAWWKQS